MIVDGLILQARRPENIGRFSTAQMEALQSLDEFIDEHSGEALTFLSRADAFEKILSGSTWSNLRTKATFAVAQFGRDMAAVSVEEIDTGRIGFEQ